MATELIIAPEAEQGIAEVYAWHEGRGSASAKGF